MDQYLLYNTIFLGVIHIHLPSQLNFDVNYIQGYKLGFDTLPCGILPLLFCTASQVAKSSEWHWPVLSMRIQSGARIRSGCYTGCYPLVSPWTDHPSCSRHQGHLHFGRFNLSASQCSCDLRPLESVPLESVHPLSLGWIKDVLSALDSWQLSTVCTCFAHVCTNATCSVHFRSHSCHGVEPYKRF